MAERPILFSGPMVRALLAGTKTQTRRVVKGPALEWLDSAGLVPWYVALPENRLCPYGYPGDSLWVREAWARTVVGTGTDMLVYREGDNRTDYGGPWKPSIHMPRSACRLWLEVTAVRIERLQSMCESDAEDEGIREQATTGWFSVPGIKGAGTTARAAYALLWNQINGAGSWEQNPWVWVVEFKRLPS